MTPTPIIQVTNLNKQYEDGFQALSNASLDIQKGEIFALLGPNGAGKTTLISMTCGLTTITSGTITIGGHDNQTDAKAARKLVGLVPQELTTDMFESVWNTVSFSRGVFGLAPKPEYIEELLKTLSLWDKKKSFLVPLSGGMKRRVMIAKALAHEPKILFLDEPTAGVDVELRKDMWTQIHKLRESGVTIILTTHYIEEAEEMADRIGIIRKGEIILVEEKNCLIKKLGKKSMTFYLLETPSALPESLAPFNLKIEGECLHYNYDSKTDDTRISDLFEALKSENIAYKDIQTKQSSLEEIFVELLNQS